jgi:hypothetical protein
MLSVAETRNIILQHPRPLDAEPVPLPVPAPGRMLVEVSSGSDWPPEETTP